MAYIYDAEAESYAQPWGAATAVRAGVPPAQQAMGRWVMGQWVKWVIFEWVTWVMGHSYWPTACSDPQAENLNIWGLNIWGRV